MNAYTVGKWIAGTVEWIEADTAFLSVVFTWDLPDAYARAVWYRAMGYKVRAGGPALFTKKAQDVLEGVAEIGGNIPDTLLRHNPMATIASRGCPVGCSFCSVPWMEGKTFTLLPDFIPRPVLCDNNLSALPGDYQDHIIARYRATEVPLLDANSGFEPATFSEEVWRRWQPINRGAWRFAYDETKEGADVERVTKMLADVSPRRKQVYTLIGNEPFEACMHRICQVIGWGCEPYAQPVMQLNTLTKDPRVRFDWTRPRLKAVQRWVNGRFWKFTDFAGYNSSARTKVDDRGPALAELVAQ